MVRSFENFITVPEETGIVMVIEKEFGPAGIAAAKKVPAADPNKARFDRRVMRIPATPRAAQGLPADTLQPRFPMSLAANWTRPAGM